VNKQDWLYVSLKVLGIYFIAAHLPTLLTTAFTLVLVITQKANPALSASTVYLWQGPVVSALGVCAGLLLAFMTTDIVGFLLKDGKK
jgi:hypothetical protein